MESKVQNFYVSLKISGKEIKLNINIYESQQSAFHKLAELYPECRNKKIATLTKIKQELQRRVIDKSIKNNLKEAIEFFLANAMDKQPEPMFIIRKQNQKNRKVSQSSNHRFKSPLHHLQQNIQAKNHSNFEEIIKNNKQIKLSNIQNKQNKQTRKYSMPVYPKNKDVTSLNNNQRAIQLKSKSRKKNINPDVIKACEIIMKKTNHSDMKQMAKQFLKENGYLHEQKQGLNTHKKIEKQDLQVMTEIKNQEAKNIESNSIQDNSRTSILAVTEVSFCSNRHQSIIKSSKYRYLDSSLFNESMLANLSKEYDKPSEPMTKNIQKIKKYSYLMD